MKLELGTSIRCADGATRELVDVVIDSSSSRVTHLVIQPAQHAEDARLVPISLASRAEDIVVAPNYAPTAFGDYAGSLDSDVTISYDRVPKGEIELRHASSVYSADGHHLGSVDAVVVDDGDRLTHLLVERGHLWWKREVALPAEAISKFENDMLTLGLTKGEPGKAI